MTTTIKIRPEILERIKGDNKVKARLAYEFDVHANTIVRWLDGQDIILTSAQAIRALSEELNLTAPEILTEPTEA